MVDDRSAAWAYAALLAAMLISSGNSMLGNLAVRAIDPLTLTFWRTAIALACVLPFAIPARHDIAMYFRRQKARALVLTLTGVVLPAWLMYRAVRWAWTVVADSLVHAVERRVVAGAALAAIALFAIDRATAAGASWVFHSDEYRDEAGHLFPPPVTSSYAHQLLLLSEALAPAAALPATPSMDSDMARIKGADVFIVFLESYGAAAYERSQIATPLAASRRVSSVM